MPDHVAPSVSVMARSDAKRDLLFTFDFPPMGGGIARWMEELALRYPPGELIVSTGLFPGWEAADAAFPNRVDRVAVAAGRLRTIPGLVRWSFRAVALAGSPAARFAWCGNIRPAGFVGSWAFRWTRLPYGIIVHGGDLLLLRAKIERSTFKRRHYRALLGAAAVFVAPSEWTAEKCRELLNELALPEVVKRVRVVPLGTNPAQYRPDVVAAEAFRKRRGLPSGRWLVTVARLVPHKGIDNGIRVVAALASQFPSLHYLVVGRGHYAQGLQQLAKSLGVADRVHILSDVSDDELPAAYAVGEIYVGLSRPDGLDIEGFGISLLEAAACGLPVVAGASGGIPDAVADGVSGILVDPNDVSLATMAVQQLLADPLSAQTLGQNGRDRVLRGFTWEQVVNELREIAKELGRQ